mgnify:FL=1|jgi:DNA repair exonuclease SbcCD nuclease subunit|tara:strand:+ start:2721 stop:3752 length:1032 start_codon:yes stop_codon:yes gene_type:complete
MKILLITDQHFGVRNDNQYFIESYRKFYTKVVIPYIEKFNIEQVIALGDTFDKRRSINFMSLEAAKDMWFDPLSKLGVQMRMLVGNHDIYYKNTLRVNAPSELLAGYTNISVIDNPTTAVYDGLPILLLPWICDENRAAVLEEVGTTKAEVCMGHLELNGFEAHPGHVMESGMDKNTFSKFKKVFSGHYHMKSSKGNVSYLGNPYQLYWNDYGCKRGFHVFDTDTLRTTFIRNPFDTFHKVYYNNGVSLPDSSELQGAYVKLIVEEKGDYAKFDYTVNQLQSMSLGDLKIIEDLNAEVSSDSVLETEDTMTLLDNYIDEIDLKVSKTNVKNLMRSLYMEASEI